MGNTKDAYEVKAGETFTHGADIYLALADARGDFRPRIAVRNENGIETEILLGHGDTVEILEEKD